MKGYKKLSLKSRLQIITYSSQQTRQQYNRIKQLCEQEANKGEWSLAYGGSISDQLYNRLTKEDQLSIEEVDGGYIISWS